MKKTSIVFIFLAVPFISMAQLSLFNLNYSMSVPLGETSDYIGNTSFRGASFEGRAFLNDNISVGGYIGWNVFDETKHNADYSGQGVDVHGTQFRFLNLLPIQVIGHYYLGGDFEKITPYVGLGAGTTHSLQRVEIGLVAFENNNWHLSFSPEVGVYIPINYNVGFNVSARYDYAVKSNDYTYSNLTFNIGFSFLDY